MHILLLQDGTSRVVSREEAEAFASSKGWLYAETSAKDGSGVVEAFEKITAEALNKLQEAAEEAEASLKLQRERKTTCVVS
jgi:hypothetical protein